MVFMKYSGLLKEIVENYSSIDLVRFIEERLNIPKYKAEELARRIEANFDLKIAFEISQKKQEFSVQNESLPERQQVRGINIYSLDDISGKDFEYFLKWLFEEMGYEVELTKLTADSGVDLVVNRQGEKIAVQAKRYGRNTKVPNTVVLKTHGGKDVYGCKRSIIVTTSFFTRHAIEDAKKLNVELWDRNVLAAKIDHARNKLEIETSKKDSVFPPYTGSLFDSLLNLEKTGLFYIKENKNRRYLVYRHGIKYPVLSFHVRGFKRVSRCVFRIDRDKPVGEYEGYTLIRSDSHYRYGPRDEEAYKQITNYLNQFL